MALEDSLEPEIAVTAAVVAAVSSPKVRGWIRQGLVYGTAGVWIAEDAVSSFARNVGQGIQQVGAAAANSAQNAADLAKATATSATDMASGKTAQKKSTHKTTTDQSQSSTGGTGGEGE